MFETTNQLFSWHLRGNIIYQWGNSSAIFEYFSSSQSRKIAELRAIPCGHGDHVPMFPRPIHHHWRHDGHPDPYLLAGWWLVRLPLWKVILFKSVGMIIHSQLNGNSEKKQTATKFFYFWSWSKQKTKNWVFSPARGLAGPTSVAPACIPQYERLPGWQFRYSNRSNTNKNRVSDVSDV